MNARARQQAIGRALEHHHAGRLAQAEAIYRQVLQQDPQHADALNFLGLLVHQAGNSAAAVDLIRRAIGIAGSVPGYHNNLGLVYRALGRGDEAAASFRRAVALKPDFAEAFSNLGNVLLDQNQLDEAVASYRRALALNPGLAGVHSNLGNTLQRQNKPDEAIESYQRALALSPNNPDIYNNLGNALRQMGKMREAIGCYQKTLALKPDYLVVHDLLLFSMLNAASSSAAEILAAHQRYASQFESPLKPFWPEHANDRDPERRLKVGYLSPDFYSHSVVRFIEPVLAQHDRMQVEIHAYYSHLLEDKVTARIRKYVDHWIPCAGLSDAQIAGRIGNDQIDILVDLAGHTGNNRLPVFARKPAPVQVTYLGYPATTGLTAMDYRLTTGDVDPAGNEAFHSERLVRLPHTLWCYRSPAETDGAPVGPTPAIARGAVTFGSMNNFAKISPETLALWGEVLRAIPDSRLVMTSVPAGSARDLLLQRLAAHGVSAERVTLHGHLPAVQFRAVTRAMDLALDPFPYTGTTTTCEALWMGLPVITLIGQTSVSRSGYALLKSAGLTELCARDAAEYVRIAVELAGDLARLNDLRQGMRQRLESSPLRDEAGLARDIEQAYRTMWREWCQARPEQRR